MVIQVTLRFIFQTRRVTRHGLYAAIVVFFTAGSRVRVRIWPAGNGHICPDRGAGLYRRAGRDR
jgi:hypothetical protein